MRTLQHKRGTAAALTANNPVIPAGEFCIETDTGKVKIGNGSTAWTSLAYLASSASDITAGTLSASRLPSSAVTTASLGTYFNQSASFVETFPRLALSGLVMTSGNTLFSFFTPLITLTVSQISIASTTAGSGLTFARMGIYTFDETTATLVARTASDTTLFTAARTLYTRSLNTTGGYPATYTLNAGTRYGIGLLLVGTTMPNITGNAGLSEISGLAPRLTAVRTSQSDLSTGAVSTSQSQVVYARLT